MNIYSHDAVFKSSMSVSTIAKDMLKAHLPSEISSVVDFRTLRYCDKSFVDRNLKQTESDMLFQVKIENDDAYIYCLFEHQSKPDKRMPLRLIRYSVNIIENYLSQGNEVYPLVIPIVIYNGKRSPYPYEQNYSEYFNQTELAKRHAFNYFNLVDLTVLPDDKIIEQKSSAFMQLAMKHYYSEQLLNKLLELVDTGVYNFSVTIHGEKYVRQMVEYVLNSPSINRDLDIVEILSQKSEGLGKMGLSWADSIRQQGVKQGVKQGMQEGIAQERVKVVQQLRAKGFSDNEICDLLGLSQSTFEQCLQAVH